MSCGRERPALAGADRRDKNGLEDSVGGQDGELKACWCLYRAIDGRFIRCGRPEHHEGPHYRDPLPHDPRPTIEGDERHPALDEYLDLHGWRGLRLLLAREGWEEVMA